MKNLIKIYNQTQNEGRNWYYNAHEWCKRLSETTNVSLPVVCGVFSALSPGTHYDQNKVDCHAMITGKKQHKFVTYGRNVEKAREILRTGLPRFNPKTGAKTYNFFHNLLEPDNSAFVTIDRWAYRIATGYEYGKLTPKQYKEIADHYIKSAKKVGLIPSELQAILWTHERNKFNTKTIDCPF